VALGKEGVQTDRSPEQCRSNTWSQEGKVHPTYNENEDNWIAF